MFNNYLATQKDLETVEDGLGFVLHPKMRFVFKDKSRIINTIVISYDSKFIYTWKINPIKLVFKIPHSLEISDKWQIGWWAGIVSRHLENYLPSKTKKSIISGGLLIPFIELQKKKGLPYNPYTTKESYLATIIHEFGHIYFGGYGKRGELSAFCAEYYASSLFWPKHTDKLDRFIEKVDPTKGKYEKRDKHTFALLNAKPFILRYPKIWPQKLFN